MSTEELLKRKTIINRILTAIIVALLCFGFFTYKKYFDEKRQYEINQSIRNAMISIKTNLEEAEENMSVMERMNFSESGDVLFISVYNIDDEVNLGDLAYCIEKVKQEKWFDWKYVVVDIFHYKLGMVKSVEINVEDSSVRDISWTVEK